MKCLNERCYSPVACGGWGYCREMNMRAAPTKPKPCPSCDTATEHWWSYCAMCGWHIASGAKPIIDSTSRFYCPVCKQTKFDGDCARDDCGFAKESIAQ